MPRRFITALLALAVLALVNVVPAVAEDQTHEGTVVAAANGKLVMSDKEGKNEHTHMVTADAKVTVDGKEAKLTDLKKGQKVRVTTSKVGDQTKVASVAATSGPSQ